MTLDDFYLQTAISALQGLQESGTKLSLAADAVPSKAAMAAFRIADAMVRELVRRGHSVIDGVIKIDTNKIFKKDEE